MIYIIIGGILLFYSLYMFLGILFGMFYKTPNHETSSVKISNHKLLVFYPAYRPDEKFIRTLIQQKKSLKNLDASVYVLAQQAEPAINKKIKKLADFVDSRSFSELNGNSYHHALEYAVGRMEKLGEWDSVLLLDPDNFMDEQSIKRLIAGRVSGNHVSLSRRKSYRQEGATSMFDGISERLNDYMFRRAKQVLGFVPELSGSGMMLNVPLFSDAVRLLDKKAPGMDKQLLIHMMLGNRDLRISFDEEAIVLDEKTNSEDQFGRQRLRWFGNQYYNAKQFGLKLLASSKMAHIDYGITLWRPPRSFQVVGTTLLLPFDLLAFWFGWTELPFIALSAILSNVAVILFLWKEGVLVQVASKSFPILKTALKNGWLAIQSMNKKNRGVFIHTRTE